MMKGRCWLNMSSLYITGLTHEHHKLRHLPVQPLRELSCSARCGIVEHRARDRVFWIDHAVRREAKTKLRQPSRIPVRFKEDSVASIAVALRIAVRCLVPLHMADTVVALASHMVP